MAHIAEKYYRFDIYQGYTGLFEAIYRIIYYFHMPLFMNLSGRIFVTAYIRNDKIEGKRFWRHWVDFAIVYLIIGILTGLAKMIFAEDLIHPFSKTDIFLIPVNPIGHTWYLYILLLFYLLAYLGYKYGLHRYKKVGLVLLMILCFASYYVPSNTYVVLQRSMQFGFYFAFGMMFMPGLDKSAPDSQMNIVLYRILPLIGVILLILKYYLYVNSGGDIQSKWMSMIIALGCSLLFIELFSKLQYLQKESLLNKIGLCSLEMYLFHQFLVSLFIKVSGKIGIQDGVVNCAINLVGTIAIIYIGIAILKKIKLYEYFFKPYTVLSRKRES